jgi:hypothetical protein
MSQEELAKYQFMFGYVLGYLDVLEKDLGNKVRKQAVEAWERDQREAQKNRTKDF